MAARNLIIFGIDVTAELAHYYFSHDSDYEVKAFCVDQKYRTSDSFSDLPLVNFEQVEDMFSPQTHSFFIATGYSQMNGLREEKFYQAKQKGYSLANYISSKATILSPLNGNENCFIFEDNTIQPFVQIGNNITLWSGNHIGHHSIIEDHCFLSSHIVLESFNHIHNNAFIGVNSTLVKGVELKPYALIAAGSLIQENVPEYAVAYGAPARIGKKRSLDVL